jgi:competence protein ComEA
VNTISRRFALWLIAALLCALFYMKSRTPQLPVEDTAFSFFSSTGNLVKIDRNGAARGIYRLKPGMTVGSVIFMTYPDSTNFTLIGSNSNKLLQQGDAVTIASRDRQLTEIIVSRMSAREMIILGIPLQPDCMTADDWVALPGIGPALAKAIIADRQQNGDYHSIEAVQRVPGVGKATLRQLKQFF